MFPFFYLAHGYYQLEVNVKSFCCLGIAGHAQRIMCVPSSSSNGRETILSLLLSLFTLLPVVWFDLTFSRTPCRQQCFCSHRSLTGLTCVTAALGGPLTSARNAADCQPILSHTLYL